MPSFSTMYAIFAVMVVVLPVPAPAKIRGGGWVCLSVRRAGGRLRERRRLTNIYHRKRYAKPQMNADERRWKTIAHG